MSDTTQQTTNIPSGWNSTTYANFKQANPTLEPTAQDTSKMLGTSLTSTMPSTTNVQAPNLNTVNPLPIPTTPVSTTPPIPTQSLADKAVAATQTQLTDAQKVQEDIISKQMKSILGMSEVGTEAQLTQDELTKLGYQQKLQDLNNLNSQIVQKQAEVNQDDVKLVANMRAEERRDTLLPFAQAGQAKLAGDAQIVRALKNSEINLLNAQVLAKQGDIELAKQTAKDAVAMKLAPYKAQIETYTNLLKALDPVLTRDEKKQASEQTLRGQVALKEIEKLSKFQGDALSAAISNKAPQSVLNAINSAQTIEDISKVGSQWIISRADKLDQQLKQAQVNKLNAENTPNGKLTADEKKAQTATTALVSLLDSYKKEINGVGFFEANSPKKRAAIDSLKGRITAEYKQAKQLGTLDAGVQKLIDQIIPDPGNFSISSLDNKAQVKAIDDFRNSFTGNSKSSSYLDTVDKTLSSGVSVIDYINSLPK